MNSRTEQERISPKATRRAALRWLIAGVGTTLLAACGPAQPGSPPPAPAGTAAPTAVAAPPNATISAPATSATARGTPAAAQTSATPRNGGVLRAGVVSELTNLWPRADDSKYGLFDKLIEYDEKLQPVARLAESWELSPDYKQIRLNLRKGVLFHNGRELTSDDVKYNLQRTTDPTKTGPLSLVGLAKVWSVETPDKYTVVMTSDQPRLGAFDLLTYMLIGDKETLDGPDGQTKGMGTGPFSFVEWIPGDHATFTRNKNYWQSGRPYLDGYQVYFNRDPQAMVVRLEAGALDFVNYPQTIDAVRLGKDPKYQVQTITDVGADFAVWMNVTVPPLDKKPVRQALNYAIDRQRFMDNTLANLVPGRVTLPWPTSSPAFDAGKNKLYEYNLDKARSLLQSAGVSGFNTEFNYATGGPVQEFAQFAQIYQADLAKLGITMTIKPMDGPTWTATAVKGAYNGLAIGQGGGFGGQDPTSGLTTGEYGAANSFSSYQSETYSQLVKDASGEVDPAKRKELYARINDLILDECFCMAMCSLLQTSVSTTNVHGIAHTTIGGFLNLTDTWMD